MSVGPVSAPPPDAGAGSYRFGAFVLDPRERRLTREGHVIDLRPKTFDALVLLVARGGRLVTKDEFFASLWPRTIVGDASLNKCIWQLRQALGENDAEPYIETVPKVGYRFVAVVERLAPDPDPRAAAIVPAPAAVEVPMPPVSAPPAPAPVERGAAPPAAGAARRRWPWLVAVAITVVALLLLDLPPWRSTPRPSATAAGDNVLAIGRLEDLNPRDDTAWFGTALLELAAAQFGGVDGLRVTPAETLRDFGFNPVSTVRAGTLDLPAAIAADWTLAGSYVAIDATALPREIQFTLTVTDAESGAELAQASRRGLESDLFELVSAAGTELRQELGLTNPRDAAYADERTVVPTDRAALVHYADGLAALRRFDLLEATRQLQEVVARAPDFAPAHAALAQAWNLLGHERRAREAMASAERLSATLPRALRLAYAAYAAELRGDWEQAIKGQEALATLYPEDPEYALRLATAQLRGGRNADAVASLDRLMRTLPDSAEDPRVLFTRARAHYMQSDNAAGLADAERARTLAERDRAPLLAAEAALHQGWTLQMLGRIDDSAAAYAYARDTFAGAGHAVNAARAAFQLLQLRFSRSGSYAQHEPEIDELLKLARGAGSRKVESNALSIQANLYWMTKRRAEGRRVNEQLIELERELGNRSGEARALIMLGTLDAAEGATEAAAAHYAQAATMLAEIGHDGDHAWALGLHGNLERERGRFARAAELLAQARAAAERSGEALEIGDADYHLAILALDRWQLADGARLLASAAKRYADIQQEDRISMAAGVEAELALAQGRADDAWRAIARDLELTRAAAAPGGTAWAAAFGARVRIAQGDVPVARNLMREAAADMPDLATSVTALTARIYLAEAHWLLGEHDAARALWREVEAEARRRGLGMIRLEAGLGLACSDPATLATRVGEARAMQFERGVAWAAANCGGAGSR